jgi:hypothetical protein
MQETNQNNPLAGPPYDNALAIPPYDNALTLVCEVYRREELAKKILAGKPLKKNERAEVFRFLTGKTPPETKRGRPATWVRDARLAIDFLGARQGTKNISKIRDALSEKYQLPKRENTFYVALNRGIRLLERFKDLHPEQAPKTDEAKTVQKWLLWIEEYKQQSSDSKKR